MAVATKNSWPLMWYKPYCRVVWGYGGSWSVSEDRDDGITTYVVIGILLSGSGH